MLISLTMNHVLVVDGTSIMLPPGVKSGEIIMLPASGATFSVEKRSPSKRRERFDMPPQKTVD
jgi:hypothetical protein